MIIIFSLKRVITFGIFLGFITSCNGFSKNLPASPLPSVTLIKEKSNTPLPSHTSIQNSNSQITLTPLILRPSQTQTLKPLTPTPTLPPKITMIFTGQIVPGRCVQAGVETNNNADYIYEAVTDYLTNADLTIGTLNAALSDFPPTTGCKETFVLVGRPLNADAMARAGFDVMSVATNHIKNCGLTTCGDRAFFDTLYHLNRVGITPVGAGNNLTEALQPVIRTIKGVTFAILSSGQIEQNAFANDNTPGIAVLNPNTIQETIEAVKNQVDVVIVMPHWGPEYAIMPNPSQQKLAKLAVEAGADLIVGNHTHVIQAITEIDNVPVFYGLGNFVFDQTWDRETQQSLILKVTFSGDQFTGYEVLPVWADIDGRISQATTEEAQQILSRVQIASQKLP